MTKRKLQHFAELDTFANVIQSPMYSEVYEHPMKGKWNEEFFGKSQPLVLELGCGKGEYTVNLAQRYGEKNFLGIDIKGNRIWRGSKTALDLGLKNAGFLRIQIERIEHFFAKDEVSEIWITFPDPQPKYKTERKRLTSPAFLERYRKILKPGGVVHLKTDSQFLHAYTLEVLKEQGIHINLFSNDIYKDFPDDEALKIKTHYEQLFLRQGMPITYINFTL
ncbi:MAG: tRNA (guanosine(46)-N7)-methyltransferase TrmB [Bacteroidota bacterium]